MSEIWSQDEVREITGLTQPAAQERFLRDRLHIPAFRNAANRVIVFKKNAAPAAAAEVAAPVPDFEAMDSVA